MIPERQRLAEDERRQNNWKRWGPYLSERQWGTVREDYSAHGDCWDYFPHDHARSRVYRWGEDGLLGMTDREGRLCFALALWNERDPILKERLFGLTNGEGNHGEDVKECYFYLDSSPTHSYMKALYKYPQREFPYGQLLEESRQRGHKDDEYEITDTGIFDDSAYFDVFAEYAKRTPDDILIRLTIANRGSEAATVHVLPTLWFRNTWAWGREGEGYWAKPNITRHNSDMLAANHEALGRFFFAVDSVDEHATKFLFTENETNINRLYGAANPSPYTKDAFHEYIVHNRKDAVNPEEEGTKAAAHCRLEIPAHGEVVIRLRLCAEHETPKAFFDDDFDRVFQTRLDETSEFYNEQLPATMSADERRVARQASAGLLWSKQFFYYIVKQWLEGDPSQPPPPASRLEGRNAEWQHVFMRDILSMPDKWEYPWFAAWDTAFHLVGFASLDPHFAKEQLLLFMREWYMHPNGALPAYEFNFNDANPPVHAWACWRVYKMTKNLEGKRDRVFLERAFQKLLLNFTWWVNRKDDEGNNIFAGGFLGLDNIGIFDRSQPLPNGGTLEQADGTAWMAFYCVTMMQMALELAHENPAYEDLASKFFEHFIAIVDAMNTLGGNGLWNEDEGFYYDEMLANNQTTALRIRSLVGLIPLYAVESLDQKTIDRMPGFKKRFDWFVANRPDLAQHISCADMRERKGSVLRLLAIPSRERLVRVLRYMLDENEFLSDYGIRSLSRYHLDNPFVLRADGREWRVSYESGESRSGIFGGNSNWRGPIWYPTTYLLVEALERYHHFYGNSLKVECPVGSGRMLTLQEVSEEISRRMAKIFYKDTDGMRPWQNGDTRFRDDPHWRDLTLFYEYFDGDTGRGIGANHQTGWTALVSRLIEDDAYTRAKAGEKQAPPPENLEQETQLRKKKPPAKRTKAKPVSSA